MRYDVVIIGGGLAGKTAATALQAKGLKCAVVADGLSLRDVDLKEFVAAGGSLFSGDRVVKANVEDGRVLSLVTERLEDELLVADNYILATGKYFSRGIVADMNSVYEPVFGLDVEADEDRSGWFDRDFAADQKFMSFGVRNYGQGRVALEGVVLTNLFAAGEVLAGITGIEADAKEIIVKSALDAVSNIN